MSTKKMSMFFASLLFVLGFAQGIHEWTWLGPEEGEMKCLNETDLRCRGIYEPHNNSIVWPGARCCSHVWSVGNIAYVWGGWGYDAKGKLGYLNDLWQFNSSSLTWAWIGGSREANKPSTPKWPGGRHYAAYAYDSKREAFYIFSGQGVPEGNHSDYLRDLWLFNMSNMRWKYVGNFTEPAPRKWSSFWSGKHGLFVLGGEGGGHRRTFNDFWMFNYEKSEWHKLYNRPGDIYGQYNASHKQFPGERHNAFTVLGDDGDLYMFGGSGHGIKPNNGTTSDVWKWKVKEREWEFLGGNPGGVDEKGTCGTRGQSSSTFLPTARHAGYNFDFLSPNGKMLIMGGEHYGESVVFNDIWSLDIQSLEFTFEAGDCNVNNVNRTVLGETFTIIVIIISTLGYIFQKYHHGMICLRSRDAPSRDAYGFRCTRTQM